MVNFILIEFRTNEILQQTIEEKEEDSTPEVPILKVYEPQSSSENSGESNENTNTSTTQSMYWLF